MTATGHSFPCSKVTQFWLKMKETSILGSASPGFNFHAIKRFPWMPETFYKQNQARTSKRCFSMITLLDQKFVYFVRKNMDINLHQKDTVHTNGKVWPFSANSWTGSRCTVSLNAAHPRQLKQPLPRGEAEVLVSFPEETMPPPGTKGTKTGTRHVKSTGANWKRFFSQEIHFLSVWSKNKYTSNDFNRTWQWAYACLCAEVTERTACPLNCVQLQKLSIIWSIAARVFSSPHSLH